MSLQALYAQIAQQEWIEMPPGWGQGKNHLRWTCSCSHDAKSRGNNQ